MEEASAMKHRCKPANAFLAAAALLLVAGCKPSDWSVKPMTGPATVAQEPSDVRVPSPLQLLLPKAISVHPFTGTRTFDEAGGVKGIDVRVQALDTFGDATKAFGKFHFVLYQYQGDSPNSRGTSVATWEEDLLDPEKNLVHWDSITRAYAFKLQWYRAIPVGQKFILAVDFSSPFTQRKFAERTFVSGQ
jgi:hypothetical protein